MRTETFGILKQTICKLYASEAFLNLPSSGANSGLLLGKYFFCTYNSST